MAAIDRVCAALQAASASGSADLWTASGETDLGGLRPVLGLFAITGPYNVTGANVSCSATTVTLTGRARFGVPGAANPNTVTVAVVLTCAAVSDTQVSFDLALTVAEKWTFDRTFPKLAPQEGYESADSQTLSWQTSFLTGLPLGSATFRGRTGNAKLRLEGALGPDGPLGKYRRWVSPWPLRLEGDVALPPGPDHFPDLDLRAAAAGSDRELGPLKLQRPGFRLRSVTGLDETMYGKPAYSELDAAGTVVLGRGKPVRADISGPLGVSRRVWRMMVEFDEETGTLENALSAIADLFVRSGDEPASLELPPGFGALGAVYVKAVEAWLLLDQNDGLPVDVQSIAVTVMRSDSKAAWHPPVVPFVKVTDIGTSWMVVWLPGPNGQQAAVAGAVFGSIELGENYGTIDLSATIPQFVIQGSLRESTSIPIGYAFERLLGKSGPAAPDGMKITELEIMADPREQAFAAEAAIEGKWPLVGDIAVTGLSFHVEATQSTVSGWVAGRLRFGANVDDPSLAVRAAYAGDATSGWTFSGALEPGTTGIDLVKLATELLGTADSSLKLNIDRLEGSWSTGSDPQAGDRAWSFAGAISSEWPLTLLDQRLLLRAGVSVELDKKPGAPNATGTLGATLTINRLAIELRRDIGIPDPAYGIKVMFGQLWAQASIGWLGTGTERHQEITVQLGGVTLGDVLEELVNLAAPAIGFSLDPPWDVLKQIELSRFLLTIDIRDGKKSVGLSYKVEKDLVVMYVEKVEVKYTLGDSGSVELSLNGRMLGLPLDTGWDVVNDPPPAVPGKGVKLAELRFLGLGQHVRMSADPETVRQAVDLLANEMDPATDPTVNPLSKSGVKFDGGSQWLVGLDVSLMETVDLAVIFNDPVLYGLSIGLRGERAGPFAGLKFEVLYKRITAEVGMYRIELQLPEAFRHVELGAVSITLGVIVVEIYTNGNFLIDLGFPYNRNYDRSFTVQVVPFVGRGGVYFGVLDGATSRRIPKIVGGTFSPVLELGVGLAVAVGKEISVGPLSGGAYLQLEVIFQGVLGFYHPAQEGGEGGTYYRAQGIAALHGKVYGQVDFKVVRASATIEASAEVSVVFEAHRATTFALRADIRVEAEVEILLVTVSFHFNATLELTTTVGSDTKAPWTLATDSGGPALTAPIRQPARLAELQATHAGTAFKWKPDLNVLGGIQAVPLTLEPLFSIDGPPLAWSGQAPVNDGPQYKIAFMLSAANGVPPGARTAAQAALRVAPELDTAEDGDDPSPAPPHAASFLVAMLLRWCLAAANDGIAPTDGTESTPATEFTAGQLDALAAELDDPDANVADNVFTRANLDRLFDANVDARITKYTATTRAGGMVIPLPPHLTLSATPGGSSDLSKDRPIGWTYEQGVRDAMNEFFPLAPSRSAEVPDDPATYDSFAGVMFRDWCLMVAKAALREARGALDGVTVEAGTGSLDDLARDKLPRAKVPYVVRAGDTVASVAAFIGEGVAELLALNAGFEKTLRDATPGDTLKVWVGLSGTSLALANADVALTGGIHVTLERVRTQVRANETVDAIATRLYASPADTGKLVTAAKLGAQRGLLRPGATLTLGPLTDPVPGTTDPKRVAAIMYVRLFSDPAVPAADWYAQAIAFENASTLAPFDADAPLPAGTRLEKVPKAQRSTETEPYTTVAGDTLLRIGAELSLIHDPDGYKLDAWNDFRTKVRLVDGKVVVDPTPTAIQLGETLDLLASRLVFPAGDVPTLLASVHDKNLLQPLAVIQIDSLNATGASLAAIAAAHDMTLAELAAQDGVTKKAGLFPPETQLKAPHLPLQKTKPLVDRATGPAGLSAISAQTSRQLLAGVRLPTPVYDTNKTAHATGDPAGLAALTGQQLDAPAPDRSDPTATRFTATVAAATGAPKWFKLGTGSGLTYSYTNQDLVDVYPASSLLLAPVAPTPEPMPLAGRAPRTYGLDHRIELQSALTLAIPSPGADPATAIGNASLWPLPGALLEKASAGSTVAFELLQGGAAGTFASEHNPLTNVTFATLIPVTIRRVAGYAHVYEVLGVDGRERDLLLAIAANIRSGDKGAGTKGYLAIAPPPDAGNAQGLAVLDADPAETFLIRGNLATDVPLSAAPALLQATFGSLADFAQLLWEASAAEGGYHLRFATGKGEDLPAGAFSDDGTTTLHLLTIAGSQQAAPASGRTLLPMNTCALVGPGLDASAHALYAEAADPQAAPAELVSHALVPPGSVGMVLKLPRAMPASDLSADASDDAAAEARLKSLYSVMRFVLFGTYTSPVAPPVTPAADDGTTTEPWKRTRALRRARLLGGPPPGTNGPVAQWRYDPVVPAARFGPASLAPGVTGLPKPERDPYRGYGAAGLQKATFALGFGDVLGNVTSGDAPETVAADMGYTDPLLGVGAWPGATPSYGVTRTDDVVTLTVTLAGQPGAALPGPAGAPAAAAKAAREQAAKYEQIWFQVVQPTLGAQILTSLDQGAGGKPTPLSVTEGTVPLQRFAAAGHLFASAAAELRPVPATGAATLRELLGGLGLLTGPDARPNADSVARLNADVPASAVFEPGQTLTVMAYATFAEGQTAEDVVKDFKRDCPQGPAPSAAQLLALAENAALPLRPNTVVAVPPRDHPLGPHGPEATLKSLAAGILTTPAQLGIDIAAQAVLADGFAFHHGAYTVTTGPGLRTLDSVRSMFDSLGDDVSIAELAAGAAEATGLFAADATLVQKHVVATEAGATLTTMSVGTTVDAVAPLNTAVPNLFAAGARIAVGAWSPAPTVPSSSQTLRQLAESHASTPEQLLAANLALAPASAPASAAKVVLPGVVTLPPTLTGVRVPYTLMPGDTLPILATQFATTAEALVEASAAMPGTVAARKSVSVTVAGTQVTVTTLDGDSFKAVCDRLHAKNAAVTLPLVAASLAQMTDVLEAGGMLVCPPAALTSKSGGAADLTATAVEQAYGVSAPAFAAANAALVGVIAPGVTLTATGADGKPVTLPPTTARDTLNAILARFASIGAAVSTADLLTANAAAALFKAGARALLPARAVTLSAVLANAGGPFATPAFPLVTTLRLQRAAAAVHPEFATAKGDSDVERADTLVPAPARRPVGADGAAALTFDAFVDACLKALPKLRLATGRVAGVEADLWVVSFLPDDIGGVTVTPGVTYAGGVTDARFFALKPLYRDLVSVTAEVRQVKPDGTLGDPVQHNMQGIDVEVWARRFLTDMELFLSAPYATQMQRSAPAELTRLLDAKWTCARGIAGGLAPVLEVVRDDNAEAGLEEARKVVAAECATSLSRAYTSSTILQYDTTASARFGSGGILPARLSGAAQRREPGSVNEEVSLTSARTELDKRNGFATFALTVRDPEHHGSVRAEPRYVFDALELNIDAVGGVDGYEDADWLSFARPLDGEYRPAAIVSSVGTTVAPIPLRTHPGLPVLRGQTAEPTFTGPGAPTLEEAAQWTLAATYAHEHAAQDEVRVAATFNSSRLRAFADAEQGLKERLASYAAAADSLGGLMQWLVDPPKDANPETVAKVRTNAAHSFATLAAPVASAWDAHWGVSQLHRLADPPSGATFAYRLRATYSHGNTGPAALTGLVVTLDQDAAGPAGAWPEIAFVRADGTEVPLLPGRIRHKRRTYAPSAEIVPEDWPVFRVRWPNLNVAAWQNGRTSLIVRRNPELRDGVATSEEFVLSTARVESPDVATPLNEWGDEFELRGATTKDALQTAFTALFGTAVGLPISVGISYRYQLVAPVKDDPGSGLWSYLPVALYPDQVLGSGTASALAAAVTKWATDENPQRTGAAWTFALTLDSALTTGARPLLILQRLTYPISESEMSSWQ
jgi:LysM repeat protein